MEFSRRQGTGAATQQNYKKTNILCQNGMIHPRGMASSDLEIHSHVVKPYTHTHTGWNTWRFPCRFKGCFFSLSLNYSTSHERIYFCHRFSINKQHKHCTTNASNIPHVTVFIWLSEFRKETFLFSVLIGNTKMSHLHCSHVANLPDAFTQSDLLYIWDRIQLSSWGLRISFWSVAQSLNHWTTATFGILWLWLQHRLVSVHTWKRCKVSNMDHHETETSISSYNL